MCLVLRRGADGISAFKMRDSVLRLRCQVVSTTVAPAFISSHGTLVWQTLPRYTQYGTEQSLPSHQTELAQKEQATMVRGTHALATAGAFRLN